MNNRRTPIGPDIQPVNRIDPAELSAAALIAACLDGDLGSAVRDRARGALTAAAEYGYEHDAARVLDTLRAYLDETDESAAGAS